MNLIVPDVCIAVALPAEAKAIIDHFSLEEYRGDASSIRPRRKFYQGRTGEHAVALLVTGIGKSSSATSVGWFQGALESADEFKSSPQIAWLNVGIAGHQQHELGAMVYANKIRESGSRRPSYPQLVFDSPVPASTVITVDEVEETYAENAAYEMEASGFFSAASQFSSAELVHVLKVVSDGPQNPTHQVNREMVKGLISKQLENIEVFVQKLASTARHLRQENAAPLRWEQWIERWHFSQTQIHQLRRLLHRWEIKVDPSGEQAWTNCQECLSSRSVLQTLVKRLGQT